ncbi:MAG TPA: Mpo1-like protein [Arenimonas sp.]|nr:Mpo1-like protein [Arenimonas sp.]
MTQPATAETDDPRRPVDRWLHSYGGDHEDRRNQIIHLVCVPAILWTVTAFFWLIPVPAAFGKPGLWMAAAMFVAWLWYWQLSRPLGLGMLAVFVLCGVINQLLYTRIGMANLGWLALAVFVIAWIGQFIGHIFEGKRPSFFTDLVYLLVGPMWTLSKLYRRLGINW